jgi:hypothetical protein
MAAQHPEYVGVVLGGHGLFTWGPTSKAAYQTTLRIIQQAADWLAGHEKQPAFGGPRCDAAAPETRRAVAAALMPLIRGKISRDERKVGHFSDAPEVLEFVNSRALDRLAPLGTSCPDHFLRTKIRPLVLPYDRQSNVDTLANSLDALLEAYRDDYSAYFQRCKRNVCRYHVRFGFEGQRHRYRARASADVQDGPCAASQTFLPAWDRKEIKMRPEDIADYVANAGDQQFGDRSSRGRSERENVACAFDAARRSRRAIGGLCYADPGGPGTRQRDHQ